MSDYLKPPELYDGLRLHQNENTAGCSPHVLEALGNMRRDQIGFYPPYEPAMAACASQLRISAEQLMLTNGLDEGILGLALAQLSHTGLGPPLEAVVPEPAFEIYRHDTGVAGGRLVQVMPRGDFSFALDEVLAAITPATRLVFLTNPNNPTGQPTPLEAVRAVARAVPPSAIVFVDEAYDEFAGETSIPDLANLPNLVIGRTFSKAYGLAGLRIGLLIGQPDVLAPIRRIIPVYSVNIAAVVGLLAALRDPAYVQRYVEETGRSKALLYAACDRMGLTYWRSAANFVLVRVGTHAPAFVAAAAKRGIYLRDRSTEPGCSGCVRIGTGVVEHTQRAIAVIEELLCAAR